MTPSFIFSKEPNMTVIDTVLQSLKQVTQITSNATVTGIREAYNSFTHSLEMRKFKAVVCNIISDLAA